METVRFCLPTNVDVEFTPFVEIGQDYTQELINGGGKLGAIE